MFGVRPGAHLTSAAMTDTPEELALDLSRASLAAQEQSENQLREKATAVLGAASIVVPVAALAIGKGPAGAAVAVVAAALAYVLCVRECGVALVPRNIHAGLLGASCSTPPRRPAPICGRCRRPPRATWIPPTATTKASSKTPRGA
jgi:hypothetical protein